MNNKQKRYPDQERQSAKIPPEFPKEYRDEQTSNFNKKNMSEDERRVKQDQDNDSFRNKKQNPDGDIVRERSGQSFNRQPSDKWT